MSRGFVKEDDLELAGTDLQERPISEHPNYVTATGLASLKASEHSLLKERESLAAKTEDAMATQRLAMIDRDLRYVQARLEQAILVDKSKEAHPPTVVFGTQVSVEDEEGEHHTFQIVGEDEADISVNKVSYVSPLAKALIGHKVGESVNWQRPAGNLTLEILEIQH